MTSDELRALADALSRQRQADEHGIYCAVPRQAVDAAIKYLRAQADAQPVAWIAHNLTTGHVKWTTDRCRAHGWIQGGNLRVKSLYTHPAPAAPQSPSDASHIYRPTSEAAQPQANLSEFTRRPSVGALIRAWEREDAQAERWKPCPQCGEDVDRECPICDGLGRVLATYSEQAEPKEGNNVWKQIIPDDVPQAEQKRDWSTIDAAIREYLDGYEQFGENDAGADACYTPTERERDLIYDAINGLLADESFVAAISTPQAEPKREPVGTLTIRDDMGAEITFHRSFTMRPRQTFAIYPNWDLLTHDIPTRGAFVVNAPKEIGNEFLPFHPAPAAPDGWKLVPVEPTREMIDAAAHHHEGEAYLPFSLYTAMLAAAPVVPQAEPKREPLSDERIAEIQRAAYERAAQECFERPYLEVLHDDYWTACKDCADAIRALGRQR